MNTSTPTSTLAKLTDGELTRAASVIAKRFPDSLRHAKLLDRIEDEMERRGLI